jgi:hypothetical protein
LLNRTDSKPNEILPSDDILSISHLKSTDSLIVSTDDDDDDNDDGNIVWLSKGYSQLRSKHKESYIL